VVRERGLLVVRRSKEADYASGAVKGMVWGRVMFAGVCGATGTRFGGEAGCKCWKSFLLCMLLEGLWL
jgi:hypothetical protein